MSTLQRTSFACLVLALFCMPGCATLQQQQNLDPWEQSNRRVHRFNQFVDNRLLKPSARVYRFLTPGPIDHGITNFFRNLGEIPGLVNKILQGKPRRAARGALRLLTNSTLGGFGFFDVASRMNLPYEYEDFSQTLAVWGVPQGRYTVLPILGPSTVRHAVGKVANIFLNPLFFVSLNPVDQALMRGVEVLDKRADLLSLESVFAADGYEFFRNAYFQRRDYLIHDGITEDPFVDDEFFEDEF